MSFAINGGQNKTDGMDKKSGASIAASYSLGAGATFRIGGKLEGVDDR